MATQREILFENLLTMDRRQFHQIVERAYPLDLAALQNTQYQGVELSLTPFMNKIL